MAKKEVGSANYLEPIKNNSDIWREYVELGIDAAVNDETIASIPVSA